MAKLLVLYKTPADTAKFDAYYTATHIPLAKKLPGLKRYEVSTGALGGPGASAFHLVASLEFESADAIERALDTPEGRAAAGDLANFAQAGADLLIFDTKDV
jgi:uncharacterized protein (TIGR02118 family)